jgi:hypothetical protein
VTVAKEHLERRQPSLLILVALELLADLDVRILFFAAHIVTEDLENQRS